MAAQRYSLGRMARGLASARVTTKRKVDPKIPDLIARDKKHIIFESGETTEILSDFDLKGISDSAR